MSTKLKVMTFNIRVDSSSDGVNCFSGRRSRIVDTLREHKPDLIGLQETQPHTRAWFNENFPEYVLLGAGRGEGYLGENSTVAYRRDIFEVISFDSFWLSYMPDIPGSTFGGDQSRCPRTVGIARLKHRDIPEPFRFCNTHLDWDGKQSRFLAVSMIKQYLSRSPEKFIITGDFNAEPHEIEMKVLGEPLGKRTVTDCTAGLGDTYHGYGKDTPMKIDYIFTDAKCDISRSFVVPDEGVDGIFISDHNPVIAEIVLEDGYDD